MRIWLGLLVVVTLTSRVEACPVLGGGDDTCESANVLAPGTVSGLTLDCSWPGGGNPTSITRDSDWFRFTVNPGQQVTRHVQFTSATGSGAATYYKWSSVYEYSPTTCTGALVVNAPLSDITVTNVTATPKDYVFLLYVGVSNSGQSVVATYDVTIQSSTVLTGVSYCPGALNSTGLPGTLNVQGTNSIAANNLVFAGSGLPSNAPALLACGTGQTQVPFGDGNRCIAGGLSRLILVPVSSVGTWSAGLDIPNLPASAAVIPGSVRYFQLYYRDVGGPLGTGFNLTNGVAVSFTP